jgi:hypothetical protein
MFGHVYLTIPPFIMGCGGGKSAQTVPSADAIFEWGIEGRVKIKSIKFKAVYDQEIKQIKVEIPFSRVTESLLEWKGREFTISDRLVKDIITGDMYSYPELKLRFKINNDDTFKEITNQSEILTNLNNLYSQLESSDQKSLLSHFETELRDFWRSVRQVWLVNTSDVKVVDIKHLGRNCLKLFKDIENETGELQNLLVSKFKPSSIKLTSRIIKQIAILDKLTGKPHIVKDRRTEYVGMTVQNEQIWDLVEDIRVYIFCWDEIPDLAGDEVERQEYGFIENGSKEIMRDFIEQVQEYAKDLGLNNKR